VNKREEFYKFIRFGIVGILNTFIDWAIFSLLFYFTPLGSNTMYGKYIANTISFSIAVANSYILNKNWTFKEKGKAETAQIVKFITVNIVSLLISLLMLYLASDIFRLDIAYPFKLLGFELSADSYIKLNVMLIKFIIVTPFVLLVNFIGNRLFVFKGDKTHE